MRVAEDALVVQRADRQLMDVVCPDRKTSGCGVELEPEPAGFQLDTVLVAENRNKQLVTQIAPVRVPIDVEPARKDRIRPPFQHVEPEGIVGAAYPHMVRYEIEYLPEAVFAKRRHHAPERRVVAKLRVQPVVIDDIVAVRAVRPRLKIG